MNDPEEAARKAEQSRALDVNRSPGAMIHHSHLDRQQEVVGVTRDDLEDILGFDGVGAFCGGLGIFLLSGSTWLIAENWFDQDGFSMDALMAFCIACAFFGMFSLLLGLYFHTKKRGRIQRIFGQTKVTGSSTRRVMR